MITADHLWMLALALAFDAAAGDPDALWKRVPHPVVVLGALIGALDGWLNRPGDSAVTRRFAGVAAIVIVVAIAELAGYALETAFASVPYGWIGTVVVASILLAGRSLYDHVAAVAVALREGGIGAGRTAVARIVGRDTATLDEAGVSRAAIESLAESFCDGVIAPAFWFALLGLPGIAAYKAINTADSMIGHRTERHANFGWAAARLDDLVNLPASRISGTLVALAAPLAGGTVSGSFRAMMVDARKHASPNAGWPEAAMAGALGLALGGPRTYGGVPDDGPWLNAGGRRAATAADIRRGLRVYLGATAIFAAVVAIAGLPFVFS